MGTITRNFANNLTTSGLLKSTAFNNDSFDNITSVPSGSVQSGDIKFISSATASSSASIEFTSGIDSTYKEYIFHFVNIHPGTDAVYFQMNFSTDGGSSYNVAKTTTFTTAYQQENDTEGNVVTQGDQDLAQSTAFKSITNQIGNDNDQSGSGYLHLFNPSSTTYVKNFVSEMSVDEYRSFLHVARCAGYGNTTSAINAVKFQMSSGNIDNGQILLFGVN